MRESAEWIRGGVALDIYQPALKGHAAASKFPVVWTFVPYNRAQYGQIHGMRPWIRYPIDLASLKDECGAGSRRAVRAPRG